MAPLILPRVQAMVLCDEVEESDQQDEVFHLTNVRSVIEVMVFPHVLSQLCVFLQMSGHEGESHYHIEVDRVETDDVIYETEAQIMSFLNPVTVVAEYFRLHNCVFPAPGLYYVQIYAGDRLIGERPLRIKAE